MNDLFDLLYQIDAVEGIALLSNDGSLIENQLSLLEGTVVTMAHTALTLKTQLQSAKRASKGFLLRVKEQNYLFSFHAEQLVIIEVAQGASINELTNRVTSLLGSQASVAAVTTPQPAQEVEEKQEGYAYEELKTKLLSLLTRVSPANIAHRIFAEQCASLPPLSSFVDQATARTLGEACFAKIPNQKRRELISKEYNEMLALLPYH